MDFPIEDLVICISRIVSFSFEISVQTQGVLQSVNIKLFKLIFSSLMVLTMNIFFTKHCFHNMDCYIKHDCYSPVIRVFKQKRRQKINIMLAMFSMFNQCRQAKSSQEWDNHTAKHLHSVVHQTKASEIQF